MISKSSSRRLEDGHDDLELGEAADVFAWLMKIQNIIDEKAGRRRERRGTALEERFAKAYPNACNDCGRLVCSCPPILASTAQVKSRRAAGINVSAAGLHTVSLWMREDGMRVDKMVLNTNANQLPFPGNVFHIPINMEQDLVNAGIPSMRNPLTELLAV